MAGPAGPGQGQAGAGGPHLRRPRTARQLLHEALIAATEWVERPPLAAVIDAVAAYVATGGPACPVCSPLQRACPGGIPGLSPSEAAEQAAALLGAAHAVRGSFDEGGPEGPSARAAVREVLGTEAFEAAFERGRALSRENAVALVTPLAPQHLRARPHRLSCRT